jgi:hypothetical protein
MKPSHWLQRNRRLTIELAEKVLERTRPLALLRLLLPARLALNALR